MIFFKQQLHKHSFYYQLIFLLFFYNCSGTKPVSKVPKAIIKKSITIEFSPSNNSILNEFSRIIVDVDIDDIKKVSFFINDTLVHQDNNYPYYYNWNTSAYSDKSKHSIYITLLFEDGDEIKSKLQNYTIDNSNYRPKVSNLIHVDYTNEEMKIKWSKSRDSDFLKYELFQSETINGKKVKINEIYNPDDSVYVINKFDPTIENWFWVKTIDTVGLFTISSGLSNKIDLPPKPIKLNPVEHYKGTYSLTWTKSIDNDFNKYIIQICDSKSSENKQNLYEIDDINQNELLITLDSLKYYQIEVEDIWGQSTPSNTIIGDFKHEIWGNQYSVLMTYKINLSSSKLTGKIPSSIGFLKNLISLSLNSNFLEGNIPYEIGNLSKLIYLDLSFNSKLGGQLPPELGKIKKLKQLYINGTNVSGNIPISIFYLRELTDLGLSDNKLKGNIPYEIEELINLKHLNLSQNNLSGSIPKEISALKYLNNLNLSQNNLSGKIPTEINELVKLETLGLFSNNLIGFVPMNFKKLTNLTYLSLYNNQLKGDISLLLSNLKKLEYLRLNGNLFTGQIPIDICNLKIDFNNTEYFNIGNNNFCPPFPQCLKNNIGVQENCE